MTPFTRNIGYVLGLINMTAAGRALAMSDTFHCGGCGMFTFSLHLFTGAILLWMAYNAK